ncbi:MAG: hypothetical protein ACKPJO_13250, partial [Dolichospermum sp.]
MGIWEGDRFWGVGDAIAVLGCGKCDRFWDVKGDRFWECGGAIAFWGVGVRSLFWDLGRAIAFCGGERAIA